MKAPSRRELAVYAGRQLVEGADAKQLAGQLASELATSNRSGDSQMLVDDIYYYLEHTGELAKANVTSAHPLSEALETKLRALAKQLTKVKTAVIENTVNPEVLGGFRLQTATRTVDLTANNQLKRLKREIARG